MLKPLVRSLAAIACAAVVGTTSAAAATITFDDIVSSPTCNSDVADGYGGLTWVNVQVECNADYGATFGNTFGSPSGEYAAFNALGVPAGDLTAPGGLFTLGGGAFASWADHVNRPPVAVRSTAGTPSALNAAYSPDG